jgi:hypothetical protein
LFDHIQQQQNAQKDEEHLRKSPKEAAGDIK